MFKKGESVISVATAAHAIALNGERGIVVHATNSVVFVYWWRLKRCVKYMASHESISHDDMKYLDTIYEEAEAAYAEFKSVRSKKTSKKTSKVRSKKSTTVSDRESEIDLTTPLGAVAAIMHDKDYTQCEYALLVEGLQNLLVRANEKFSDYGALTVVGSGLETANDTREAATKLKSLMQNIGLTYEQLQKM